MLVGLVLVLVLVLACPVLVNITDFAWADGHWAITVHMKLANTRAGSLNMLSQDVFSAVKMVKNAALDFAGEELTTLPGPPELREEKKRK